MKRKQFIRSSALAAAGILTQRFSFATGAVQPFPAVRTPLAQRKFSSPAVEQLIRTIQKNTGNTELAWLFENCFPNTLDTTVDFEYINGLPDTFVITGDIDAMWLRDSSAQVWPYLGLVKEDRQLKELIKGVINRQVKCILKDPYANAFYKDEAKISEWKDDHTTMLPGVHERKWEVDSLCYPIRLAHGYWQATGDGSIFTPQWQQAMQLVVQTFRQQQRMSSSGPYRFQRTTANPTDSVPLGGYGPPAVPTGLIYSVFRPSDDAVVFPFNIPANLFAAQALQQLAAMHRAAGSSGSTVDEALALRQEVTAAVKKHGIVQHARFGSMYAYEVNGLGSINMMDDSNVPSLLSLPYIADGLLDKQLYRNTRSFVLSSSNPYFFKGKAAEGIGGPHVGMDYIWPMSITMRALTSSSDAEIRQCLRSLQATHAGTGFMHEAFHKDDAAKYTRKWFAWANTLFGELVWKLYRERRYLLG